MLRAVFVLFLGLFLAACVPDASSTFVAPSGASAHTVRCTSDAGQCMQKASETCSGSYQVLDSHSNAGGLVADVIPGPVTWYTLTYACGATDGKMPTFPFEGGHMTMPTFSAPPTQPRYSTTARTNCTSSYGNVNCTTTSY